MKSGFLRNLAGLLGFLRGRLSLPEEFDTLRPNGSTKLFPLTLIQLRKYMELSFDQDLSAFAEMLLNAVCQAGNAHNRNKGGCLVRLSIVLPPVSDFHKERNVRATVRALAASRAVGNITDANPFIKSIHKFARVCNIDILCFSCKLNDEPRLGDTNSTN